MLFPSPAPSVRAVPSPNAERACRSAPSAFQRKAMAMAPPHPGSIASSSAASFSATAGGDQPPQRGGPPFSAPPSHAGYILGQVRSGLAHLRATGALDVATYDRVDGTLTGAVLREEEPPASTTSPRDAAVADEDTLGKRNAWLRDTLTETALLPSLVETALSIGVPSALLGDTQRDAIVELVERSQKTIAKVVTDPKHQRRAQSVPFYSAKTSYMGLRKGWQAAGQGLQDMAARRQEAKLRADERRAGREEEKDLQRELKQEREAVAKKRQLDMLYGSQSSSEAPAPAAATGFTSSADVGASPKEHTDSSEMGTLRSSPAPSGTSSAQNLTVLSPDSMGGAHDELAEDGEGAMASVSCARVPDEENSVAATTVFSPWPGLLLASTILAVSDEPIVKPARLSRVRHQQAPGSGGAAAGTPQGNTPLVPPPTRRVAAPPAPRTPAPAPSEGDAQQSSDSSGTWAAVRDSDERKVTRQRTLQATPTPSSASVKKETAQPTPPPRQPQPLPPSAESNDDTSAQKHKSPLIPAATQSTTHHSTAQQPETRNPPSPPSAQTPTQAARTASEVRDVTDSKQKGWVRKLGL